MAKFTHGGRRKGAGRKSAFAQKSSDKPIAMCFTPAGHRALRRLQRRTKLSRNGAIGLLVMLYADALVFTEDGVAYPNKGPEVLSIRIPRAFGRQLRAARKRTGKSFSDLGERLVRDYGHKLVVPSLGDISGTFSGYWDGDRTVVVEGLPR